MVNDLHNKANYHYDNNLFIFIIISSKRHEGPGNQLDMYIIR